jgi:hypothetical protein
MRRIFFERVLEDLDLQVLADPAQQQVLVMPVGPLGPLELDGVAQALEHVGLQGRVVAERSRWQSLESVVAIPWSEPCA